MSRAIWAQMMDKCKENPQTLQNLCQLMWQIAMGDSDAEEIKEFFDEELGLDPDEAESD